MGMTITDKELTRGRGGIWLTYLVGLLILLATQLYGLSLYAGLPETVPTHWGPSGAPDAFADKSPGAVFGMLWIGAGVIVVLAFIAAVVPAMSPARSRASEYRRVRREGMIRGTMNALGVASIALAAVFSSLALQGWLRPEHVGGWFAVFLAPILLVPIGWAMWWGSRWGQRRVVELGIHPDEDEAAEERRWVAGGLFYNDPADPQILVPKREGTGTGLTINIGNPKGKWAIVIFLLVILGLPIAMSLGIAAGTA
ncbi:DUF1648 domain-containing protein [Arthrobacter rhombi]|uniref:DUF1648 domain-containing protein n=2 Tax=Arthrobacter rhombi TaxID=71253 RepID=UPI003FD39F75